MQLMNIYQYNKFTHHHGISGENGKAVFHLIKDAPVGELVNNYYKEFSVSVEDNWLYSEIAVWTPYYAAKAILDEMNDLADSDKALIADMEKLAAYLQLHAIRDEFCDNLDQLHSAKEAVTVAANSFENIYYNVIRTIEYQVEPQLQEYRDIQSGDKDQKTAAITASLITFITAEVFITSNFANKIASKYCIVIERSSSDFLHLILNIQRNPSVKNAIDRPYIVKYGERLHSEKKLDEPLIVIWLALNYKE